MATRKELEDSIKIACAYKRKQIKEAEAQLGRSLWDIPEPIKLVIGKEYEVLQQFATLEAICGDTAVMRNRWDSQFEVNKNDLREKQLPKKK